MTNLPPPRLPSAWAVIREALGLSADVAGILALVLLTLPVVAAVGAFLVGFWPITVALILAVSLSLNGFLAYRLLAAGRRISRVREAVQDAIDQPDRPQPSNTQTHSARPAQAPTPPRWLANPVDPGGLTAVTEAQLDSALMRAQAVARDVLGEDAVVVFDRFYAMLSPFTLNGFHFLGHSRIGERSARFLVTGPESPAVVSEITRQAESQFGVRPASPWHLDHGWKELVRRVWAKERPFTGDFSLVYHLGEPGEWQVVITPVREGIREPTLTYELHDTDLVQGIA